MTPSKVVGDLQIGHKKVTLNHLDCIPFFPDSVARIGENS